MSPVLEIEDLSGGYRGADVLRDVDLRVEEGAFLGLIGPNGSGKTTLLRFCTRLLVPRKGTVRFRGRDIRGIGRKELCREVAFVSRDLPAGFSFSVMEMVLMGRIPHLGRLQRESRHDLRIAQEALKLTGTLEFKDKYLDELSAGERQRVVIAMALAQEPRLLFLDEPTSHLDIGHQVQIMDLLKRLNRRGGLTVVMVMHDLNLAGAYCERIALMDNGAIFREGTPQEVLTYPNIEAVYKTIVLVDNGTAGGRPNIILVPGEK